MAKSNYGDSEQTTALAVAYEPTDTVLARLGFGEERAKAFIYAEAAIMKVDPGLLDIPENIAEVVKAAEYTRSYGLTPGIHLHMQGPFNTEVSRKLANGNTVKVWEKRLALVVGEQAYKTAGRIQAQRDGDYIDWEWEPLTPDEVKAYAKENFPKAFVLTEDDRMVRARMLSMKSAQLAQMMGKRYDPPWVYAGVFFKGVPNNYGKYPKSDEGRVPNQRTALDKAVQRAIKKATMQKYGLIPLDSLSEEQRMNEVIRRAQPDSRASWMAADRDEVEREADGDALWASEPPQHRQGRTPMPAAPIDEEIEGEFSVSGEAEGSGDPMPGTEHKQEESDNPFDDPTAGVEGEAVVAYDEIADDLPDSLRTLAEWAAGENRNGAGPATKPQYGFLGKEIDAITGGSHTVLLSVLCRRYVNGENPCSTDLASKLLDAILKKTAQKDAQGKPVKANGKNVYIDNANYRKDVVDRLAAIAKFANERRQRVAA